MQLGVHGEKKRLQLGFDDAPCGIETVLGSLLAVFLVFYIFQDERRRTLFCLSRITPGMTVCPEVARQIYGVRVDSTLLKMS